ncbi:Uu.00g068300.m01.CDS01 [Anthostomella pinea]|uniref:Uu.00g068300.m01.CDS01 n=1 Tax=Anthostomella pinea TaxID=933095 RepID=A0AAI8VV55_9PEZI|nr:Uu.00g068300.m01.CDS01 [Anthostomella pinea]
MQFTTAILSTLLAGSAVASPLSTFAATEWTIESLKRTCATDDSSCTWTFGISTGAEGAAATACTYEVKSSATANATEASGGPVTCGAYTVTSGWSGQFGAGQGFTTLSVVDTDSKLIAYPAYTDTQLVNGTVVTPDLSFPVQTLPGQ